MLHFDRSTVKHGTQNIQNDRHQLLSGSFSVHQIRFRPGSAQTPLGELTAPPGPLAGLRGTISKGEREREKKWGKKRRRRRKESKIGEIPGSVSGKGREESEEERKFGKKYASTCSK